MVLGTEVAVIVRSRNGRNLMVLSNGIDHRTAIEATQHLAKDLETSCKAHDATDFIHPLQSYPLVCDSCLTLGGSYLAVYRVVGQIVVIILGNAVARNAFFGLEAATQVVRILITECRTGNVTVEAVEKRYSEIFYDIHLYVTCGCLIEASDVIEVIHSPAEDKAKAAAAAATSPNVSLALTHHSPIPGSSIDHLAINSLYSHAGTHFGGASRTRLAVMLSRAVDPLQYRPATPSIGPSTPRLAQTFNERTLGAQTWQIQRLGFVSKAAMTAVAAAPGFEMPDPVGSGSWPKRRGLRAWDKVFGSGAAGGIGKVEPPMLIDKEALVAALERAMAAEMTGVEEDEDSAAAVDALLYPSTQEEQASAEKKTENHEAEDPLLPIDEVEEELSTLAAMKRPALVLLETWTASVKGRRLTNVVLHGVVSWASPLAREQVSKLKFNLLLPSKEEWLYGWGTSIQQLAEDEAAAEAAAYEAAAVAAAATVGVPYDPAIAAAAAQAVGAYPKNPYPQYQPQQPGTYGYDSLFGETTHQSGVTGQGVPPNYYEGAAAYNAYNAYSVTNGLSNGVTNNYTSNSNNTNAIVMPQNYAAMAAAFWKSQEEQKRNGENKQEHLSGHDNDDDTEEGYDHHDGGRKNHAEMGDSNSAKEGEGEEGNDEHTEALKKAIEVVRRAKELYHVNNGGARTASGFSTIPTLSYDDALTCVRTALRSAWRRTAAVRLFQLSRRQALKEIHQARATHAATAAAAAAEGAGECLSQEQMNYYEHTAKEGSHAATQMFYGADGHYYYYNEHNTPDIHSHAQASMDMSPASNASPFPPTATGITGDGFSSQLAPSLASAAAAFMEREGKTMTKKERRMAWKKAEKRRIKAEAKAKRDAEKQERKAQLLRKKNLKKIKKQKKEAKAAAASNAIVAAVRRRHADEALRRKAAEEESLRLREEEVTAQEVEMFMTKSVFVVDASVSMDTGTATAPMGCRKHPLAAEAEASEEEEDEDDEEREEDEREEEEKGEEDGKSRERESKEGESAGGGKGKADAFSTTRPKSPTLTHHPVPSTSSAATPTPASDSSALLFEAPETKRRRLEEERRAREEALVLLKYRVPYRCTPTPIQASIGVSQRPIAQRPTKMIVTVSINFAVREGSRISSLKALMNLPALLGTPCRVKPSGAEFDPTTCQLMWNHLNPTLLSLGSESDGSLSYIDQIRAKARIEAATTQKEQKGSEEDGEERKEGEAKEEEEKGQEKVEKEEDGKNNIENQGEQNEETKKIVEKEGQNQGQEGNGAVVRLEDVSTIEEKTKQPSFDKDLKKESHLDMDDFFDNLSAQLNINAVGSSENQEKEAKPAEVEAAIATAQGDHLLELSNPFTMEKSDEKANKDEEESNKEETQNQDEIEDEREKREGIDKEKEENEKKERETKEMEMLEKEKIKKEKEEEEKYLARVKERKERENKAKRERAVRTLAAVFIIDIKDDNGTLSEALTRLQGRVAVEGADGHSLSCLSLSQGVKEMNNWTSTAGWSAVVNLSL
uniref:Uncharacterized protein n=1 Tax=Polytomella parva TaxID=51329 RepID=A0A7S0YK76_9CHLO|mmetsp:Transcript_30684/g.55869  ORF Transcript_30684/g.55869 Transcript_30684/m.55869 type:complete len:1516 (+) Transcript_30684:415-4962(+)|eukprot:CAMPEP_0175072244 /NCGR_PEP_ID=MMETSP0052_2-20121109/19785_1 /TAXON_ID=51329 ORGANISM="Polytomella parva, Strain SAG 63-3" /NCGR_SAMPLE_ID=MMETSP0052_2 /ASSEMBLY_ACC=CAM_ASM_000194 /LENGTH=1515 /DNA_ID=CAMNT_0016339693 /DNA_START=379 /DNA_END=4926 /DNA_ORIENTATION=-